MSPFITNPCESPLIILEGSKGPHNNEEGIVYCLVMRCAVIYILGNRNLLFALLITRESVAPILQIDFNFIN